MLTEHTLTIKSIVDHNQRKKRTEKKEEESHAIKLTKIHNNLSGLEKYLENMYMWLDSSSIYYPRTIVIHVCRYVPHGYSSTVMPVLHVNTGFHWWKSRHCRAEIQFHKQWPWKVCLKGFLHVRMYTKLMMLLCHFTFPMETH